MVNELIAARFPGASASCNPLLPTGALRFAPLLGALLLAACGPGKSGSQLPQSGTPGQELPLPGGSGATFFVDPNSNGTVAELQIVEILFGRLVDIHDVDANGMTSPLPLFTNLLVELDQLGSAGYRLESNSFTGRERLVILVQRSVDPTSFNTLFTAATDDLVTVVRRNDDGLDPGPFSVIPRNCSMSIRFNDMLDDGLAAEAALLDNVKLFVGNLPNQAFAARVLFDQHHGALLAGNYHTTRILIDLSISQAEAAASGGTLAQNTTGLPIGDGTNSPNASIHIPTQFKTTGMGPLQLTLLRGVNGSPLDFATAGPVSVNETLDVVRAFRPGNALNAHNGFMPDNVPPEILGNWDITVATSIDDPAGTPGFDFLVDLQFSTACRSAIETGDLIELGAEMLLVSAAAAPDMAGNVLGLGLRSLGAISDPDTLLGTGLFVSPLDLSLTGVDGCWVRFLPAPSTPITGSGPVAGVTSTANLSLRFSEPMDPASMSILDRLILVRGNSNAIPTATNRVAGSFSSDISLETWDLSHPLAFEHTPGMQELFTLFAAPNPSITAVSPTDLAGNAIGTLLPPTEFSIDAAEPVSTGASLIFRFDRYYQEDDTPGSDNEQFAGINEVDNPNSTSLAQIKLDFAGSFSTDARLGLIRGRDVTFQGFVLDRTQPTVNSMFGIVPPIVVLPSPMGVLEPLTPMGSKTQTLWRFFDMGMYANQQETLDIDVVGVSWAPTGGGVAVRDFIPAFEMKLGLSEKMPHEPFFAGPPPLLAEPLSGIDSMLPFGSNTLVRPDDLLLVHDRQQGYDINPVNGFNASTGTGMFPYPMNQGLAPGESMITYTWRDRANLDAAVQAISIPTFIDAGINGPILNPPPPFDLNFPSLESTVEGEVVPAGTPTPAVFMPLLMEFSCFPSFETLGVNRLLYGLLGHGLDGGNLPVSRVYSAGGINALGEEIFVDPDLAMTPSGGFNPGTGSLPTSPGDDIYYLGQLDTVIRVTRLVSHWIDMVGLSPSGELTYGVPIMEPALSEQPLGTSIQLAYRSARSFSGVAVRAFDPAFMSPMGNPVDHLQNNSVHIINFQNVNVGSGATDGSIWTSDLTEMRSRYLQIRITFINNIDTGDTPFLSALAFPYEK